MEPRRYHSLTYSKSAIAIALPFRFIVILAFSVFVCMFYEASISGVVNWGGFFEWPYTYVIVAFSMIASIAMIWNEQAEYLGLSWAIDEVAILITHNGKIERIEFQSILSPSVLPSIALRIGMKDACSLHITIPGEWYRKGGHTILVNRQTAQEIKDFIDERRPVSSARPLNLKEHFNRIQSSIPAVSKWISIVPPERSGVHPNLPTEPGTLTGYDTNQTMTFRCIFPQLFPRIIAVFFILFTGMSVKALIENLLRDEADFNPISIAIFVGFVLALAILFVTIEQLRVKRSIWDVREDRIITTDFRKRKPLSIPIATIERVETKREQGFMMFETYKVLIRVHFKSKTGKPARIQIRLKPSDAERLSQFLKAQLLQKSVTDENILSLHPEKMEARQ